MQKFLKQRPSKIKIAAKISRKIIIKSIFFVKKKKQDFSAAKTPHSNVEVNHFCNDILHHWITYYLKKKEIKNAQTD